MPRKFEKQISYEKVDEMWVLSWDGDAIAALPTEREIRLAGYMVSQFWRKHKVLPPDYRPGENTEPDLIGF